MILVTPEYSAAVSARGRLPSAIARGATASSRTGSSMPMVSGSTSNARSAGKGLSGGAWPPARPAGGAAAGLSAAEAAAGAEAVVVGTSAGAGAAAAGACRCRARLRRVADSGGSGRRHAGLGAVARPFEQGRRAPCRHRPGAAARRVHPYAAIERSLSPVSET